MSICIYCGQDHVPGLRLCPKTGKPLGNSAQVSQKTLFGVAPPPVPPPSPAGANHRLTSSPEPLPADRSKPPAKPAPVAPVGPAVSKPSPSPALAKTAVGVAPTAAPQRLSAPPPLPPPRLPTEQEARDNPDLIISLDVTPPAGYPLRATAAPKSGAKEEARRDRIEQVATAAKVATNKKDDDISVPVDLACGADGLTVIPPDEAVAAPSLSQGPPVDLPSVSQPGNRQSFALPMPPEDTARRTPPESSRIMRDGKLVIDLLRWAAANYRRNFKVFVVLAASLVVPAAAVESCVVAATLPAPSAAVMGRLGTTVDFSARKAELATRIRQAQARGQMDGKAVAELAALSSVENATVPLGQTKLDDGGAWLRARLAAFLQGFFLFGLALPLALAALALATIDQHAGAALPSLADVWPILMERGKLLLSSLVPAAFLVGLGNAVFVLPGLILAVLFVFLPHVVIFEKRGGREALARSLELARTDGRRAVLAFVLMALPTVVAILLAESTFPPSDSRAVAFTRFFVSDCVVVAVLPVPAMVLARLYLDIRSRTGSQSERLCRAARS